jgi:hypothetical protein
MAPQTAEIHTSVVSVGWSTALTLLPSVAGMLMPAKHAAPQDAWHNAPYLFSQLALAGLP